MLLALVNGSSANATTTPRAAARPAADAQLVLQQHTLYDPASGGMASHTILAPKGWSVAGGAWWARRELFSVLPSQNVLLAAPDGRFVNIGPNFAATDYRPAADAWQWGGQRPAEGSVDNGYPVVYLPDTLEDWSHWLQNTALPAEYPQARRVRVTNAVIIPELTELLRRKQEPLRRQQEIDNYNYAMSGAGVRGFCETAALAFEWSYRYEGQDFDAMIVMAYSAFGNESQAGTQVWWGLEPVVTFGAPKGELDAAMPLLQALANSLRITPQWAQMKTDHMRALNRIAAKGAADRSAIIADTNREINQIINDGWNERSKSMDSTHAKYINSIREVENYTVAGSNTAVELPSNYGHVFSNGRGEYILTDDALFDPNTDPAFNGANWNSMRAVQ